MTKSGFTRGNESWMRERDVVISARPFRCEPHLKIKTGGAKDSPHLRLSIHFALDGAGESARIILGHVGRHLTTRTSADW